MLSLGPPAPTHFSTFWAGEPCLALGPGEEEEKARPGGWAVQGRERQTKGPALDQAGPLSDDPQACSWGGLPGPTEGGEGDPRRPRHTEETQTEVGGRQRQTKREKQKGEMEAGLEVGSWREKQRQKAKEAHWETWGGRK